jgi:Rrf2 family protein
MLELLESRRLQYVMTALLRIAAAPHPLSGKQIADKLECPRRYLESDLQILAQGGILESRRGARGGYVLARNPVRITLLDILRCLVNEHGYKNEGRGCRLMVKVVRPGLSSTRQKIEQVLADTTLAEWLRDAEESGLLSRPRPPADFMI